jgi:mannose-6-phosphate isomerase-like protein (cupin superfamily)
MRVRQDHDVPLERLEIRAISAARSEDRGRNRSYARRFQVLPDKVNLAEKLAEFTEQWAPRTVAQLNDFDIMVVKVRGEFVWHSHDNTDDFFLVLKGRLAVRLRDRAMVLDPGELFVVPRGVEHQTFAEEETHLLLIEPTGTPNTGDAATAAPRRPI